jgi:dTDP-4-dehydrorhamnose reductase
VDRAAQACAQRGVTFATVSTDYVFDGTRCAAYREDDAPNPLTAYGASKLAGELLVRRHGPRHYIFRTSGVFGTAGTSNKGYTLIEKVLQQAERGEMTRMVSDMVFSPSYAPHVARAMTDVFDAEAFGTHHVTNAGACSWYDFVKAAFAKAGLADAPLEPITYASFGNPTKRPMYSPLENTTFATLGVAPLPHWGVALDDFLAARRARLAVAGS